MLKQEVATTVIITFLIIIILVLTALYIRERGKNSK